MKRQKEVDEDEILRELQYIRTRINSASTILTDRTRTAFFFVVTPEQMILIDTKKAAELFAKFDVPIGGYVVNRVLPEELKGQNVPAYLRNRMEMQTGQLEEIRRTLGSQIVGYVPELERDVTGLPMIERVAEEDDGEHEDEHDAEPVECRDARRRPVAERDEVEEPGERARHSREHDEAEGARRDRAEPARLAEHERRADEEDRHHDGAHGGRERRVDVPHPDLPEDRDERGEEGREERVVGPGAHAARLSRRPTGA